MSPWELMLWALAVMVVVVCAAIAVSVVVSVAKSLRSPKRGGEQIIGRAEK